MGRSPPPEGGGVITSEGTIRPAGMAVRLLYVVRGSLMRPGELVVKLQHVVHGNHIYVLREALDPRLPPIQTFRTMCLETR